MNKKTLLAGAASLLLFSCQQEKTAFVDNEVLVEEYQERKDIEEKYKAKIAALTKKKDSIGLVLQSEGLALQEKGERLSESAKQELYGPYIQKRQLLQQLLQQEEQAMSSESQTEIDELLKKIKDAITAYGRENEYTYIFGKNQAGSVLYGAEKNDITTPILENLNAQYSK